jgi:hypothetical protein
MDNTDILSIQPYTLGELDRVLDAVKQAGYRHVETFGSHLDDAETVRAKLEARGLKVSSSHVSLVALRANFFGGEPMVMTRDGEWMPLEISAHPFGKPNRHTQSGLHVADYRMVGVLDMAAAIRDNRPHRASGELAIHVLEVLETLERSSIEGRHIMIETTCDRPEPLLPGEGEEVFAVLSNFGKDSE